MKNVREYICYKFDKKLQINHFDCFGSFSSTETNYSCKFANWTWHMTRYMSSWIIRKHISLKPYIDTIAIPLHIRTSVNLHCCSSVRKWHGKTYINTSYLGYVFVWSTFEDPKNWIRERIDSVIRWKSIWDMYL